LLQPHVSYLKPLEGLLDSGMIKGLAHITGGGLTDNIPRILPPGAAVEIERGSWPILPIFQLLQTIGNVSEAEMYRAFNMGAGMVIVCDRRDAQKIELAIENNGETCYEVGRVVTGQQDVRLV
jgi:phosphoribosylformylglycinamidine cyclo-ligase